MTAVQLLGAGNREGKTLEAYKSGSCLVSQQVTDLSEASELGKFWVCNTDCGLMIGASDVYGSFSSAPAADGPYIPLRAQAVIEENCTGCHSDPPTNDAPMPLTGCNDILSPAVTDSSITVGEMIMERINDIDYPMPPDGLMHPDDRAEIGYWLRDETCSR